MKKASIQDLRFRFKPLLEGLRRGEEITLTYRNKPLARIVPLDREGAVTDDDPALQFHEGAEKAAPLSNREIDEILYPGPNRG